MFFRGRFRVRLADAFVTLLVQFGGKFGAAGFDDAAAEHHVGFQRDVVFQQLFVVRDDQNAHVRAADFGDALAGQPHCVGIQPAVGFVENGEFRLQHRQLQNFCPFHFAAGETFVHVAAGEFGIDFQLLHFRAKFIAEFPHRN